MPCYTTVQTNFIDVDALQAAAKEMGITMQAQGANAFRLRSTKTGDYVTIQREKPGAKFQTETYSASDDYVEEILNKLAQPYGKVMLKKWSQKNGYNFAAGTKPNEYVMTKY